MDRADLPSPMSDLPDTGRLAHNITHFVRALRRTGLRIGPGQVIEAIRSVEAAGFSSRGDFYWTLQACLISRPEERAVFAQVFRLFWRDPQFLEHMMSMLLPAIRGVQDDCVAAPAEKRAAEALLDGATRDLPPQVPGEDEVIETDASATVSDAERLKTLDFEQMSVAEMAEARRMIARLTLPVRPIASRRTQTAIRGDLADWQATMRRSLARGGEISVLVRRKRRPRWPNLVVLCDISGSMAHYSRMVLHFVHSVANTKGAGWARVHAFTFGTRLTNITRHLASRDVDQALKSAGAEAQDWQGGTRIGDCLHRFNRDWSRRVMGQGAVVLLITDGLDRDVSADLGAEMQRLHLSARHLIWINPLLRWDGFAPKARGIAAMIPHVDSFCAGHNIASLQALTAAIANARDGGEKARMMAALRTG
jgi:uncharacterized protein with von Willebrand factor type A (vWA) domain